MFDNPTVWCGILEVDFATLDERSLKRAYAKKIKTIDAAADSEDFQRVRAAYEGLRPLARRKANLGQEAPRPKPMPTFPPSEPKPQTPTKTPKAPPPPELKKPRKAPRQDPLPEPNTGGRTSFDVIDEKAASVLIDKVRSCLKNPWSSNELIGVLNDPLMDKGAIAARVELAIGAEIISFARRPDKLHELPSSLNRKVLQALEKRFAWYSDIARLRKTFGFNAQHLVNALVLSPENPLSKVSLKTNTQSVAPPQKMVWRQVLANLLAFPWFVSSFFVVFLTFGFGEIVLPYVFP